MSIKGTNPSIVAWPLRGLGSSTSGNTPPPQISEAQSEHYSLPHLHGSPYVARIRPSSPTKLVMTTRR